MVSPYTGRFRVSQIFRPGHTGLDLVGVDNKNIYSTIVGTVDSAGWESSNHNAGFGLYIVLRDRETGWYYYFGHLSRIDVRAGQQVSFKQKIGVEGNTGYSTGSHLHYEIRSRRGAQYAGSVNVAHISGIPNALGTYDDGYDRAFPRNMTVMVNPGSNLNVRTGPGAWFPIARFSSNVTIDGIFYRAGQEVRYPRGTVVTIFGIENGWARGVRGYMSAAFLSF